MFSFRYSLEQRSQTSLMCCIADIFYIDIPTGPAFFAFIALPGGLAFKTNYF